jgi:tetratricopeptide (TPR) repeat protein
MFAIGGAMAQTAGPAARPADEKSAAQSTASPADSTQEMPPEEDVGDAPKVYSFNPVQSDREVRAGDFYFKKGNFTAAANRFSEATKWNDGNALAWMRLGEAQEKKSNPKGAREAYQKYLEIAPDAKNAGEVKKRLAKLKG